MSNKSKIYKGKRIKIDLNKNQFKREFDKNWFKLPPIKFIALTQVNMKQNGGGRGGRITHKYKAYCVYIKTEKLNILAYRGKKNHVINESKKIAAFLNVEIKDFITKNEDGSFQDEDFGSISSESIQGCYIVVALILIMLVTLALLS